MESVTRRAKVEENNRILERIKILSEELFESLNSAPGEAPNRCKQLLKEIEDFKLALSSSGATGLRLLVGSDDIHCEAVVRQKLQTLDEKLLATQHQKITSIREAAEIARASLENPKLKPHS